MLQIDKPCACDLQDGDIYKEWNDAPKRAIQVQEFDKGFTVFYTELNDTRLMVESFTEYAALEWIKR